MESHLLLKLYRFLNAVSCVWHFTLAGYGVLYLRSHALELDGQWGRMWPARMFNDMIVTFQCRNKGGRVASQFLDLLVGI